MLLAGLCWVHICNGSVSEKHIGFRHSGCSEKKARNAGEVRRSGLPATARHPDGTAGPPDLSDCARAGKMMPGARVFRPGTARKRIREVWSGSTLECIPTGPIMQRLSVSGLCGSLDMWNLRCVGRDWCRRLTQIPLNLPTMGVPLYYAVFPTRCDILKTILSQIDLG